MKKTIIAILGLIIICEAIVYLLDSQKHYRLLEKITTEMNPAILRENEIQIGPAELNSESLYTITKIWINKSGNKTDSVGSARNEKLLNLYGIYDTARIIRGIERTPIVSKAFSIYSCGGLCGNGRENTYIYFFGLWVPISRGREWVN